MGKLLPFERREKERGEPRPDRSGKAEILIFTGVRYEREAPPPKKPSPGSNRKRG